VRVETILIFAQDCDGLSADGKPLGDANFLGIFWEVPSAGS
jgi:hypothetical protein